MTILRCLPFLFAVMPSLACAQAQPWTISAATGNVSFQLKGRTTPANVGDVLPAGAALLTGRDGHAVLMQGGDRVDMAGNARLRLDPDARLFADRGKAVYALAHEAAVATPFLVVQGEAMRVSITVTEGGASVLPQEGAVDVATADGALHRRIQPGMVALVGADERGQIIVDGAALGIVRPKVAAAIPDAAVIRDGSVEIAALR